MLYTRKGDKGTTKIFNTKSGVRISKSSCQTEALGSLDELNSYLGLCRAESLVFKWKVESLTVSQIVRTAQENLFIIQAELAGADKTIKPSKIGEIEVLVDEIEKLMPPIKTFFIPGATKVGAMFDVARTLARKAERRVITAVEHGDVKIGSHTGVYLNRLSSLLYALARITNHKFGAKEEAPKYK